MKIGIMIWGVFLIVGAIADQVVMPNILSSVNDLTNSIQGNVMSGLPVDVQASQSFATASTEMTLGLDHMNLQLMSMEKYMQMSSISAGLIGVGLVIFGGLAQNNKKFKTKETPIEILKKRLAKGEITKTEFENIAQDLQ